MWQTTASGRPHHEGLGSWMIVAGSSTRAQATMQSLCAACGNSHPSVRATPPRGAHSARLRVAECSVPAKLAVPGGISAGRSLVSGGSGISADSKTASRWTRLHSHMGLEPAAEYYHAPARGQDRVIPIHLDCAAHAYTCLCTDRRGAQR